MSSSLPIQVVLEDIQQQLRVHDQLVLEAPPGAGKTTGVPLALLSEPWLRGQKILVLEPRRLAARAAAERMAQLLGESAGQTVGYRMRLQTKVSASTRIEVITEGILTRMLQTDPSLDGVGLVIFDEFHERSLDADLALALCLQGREYFREENTPLKLMVMSATLDDEAVAALLCGSSGNGGPKAPIVRSEGRSFPVDVIYGDARQVKDDWRPSLVSATRQALESQQGSILVFLPGQAEIRRAEQALIPLLQQLSLTAQVILATLYGDLTLERQRAAIQPCAAGQRKVVLATDIAQTSLTIEGVNIVIDLGLNREARFDPATGMNRLHTNRVSRASSIQRAGRAGRLQAGCCYRLWSQTQQDQLASFETPEIQQADLAPLALQLVVWGVSDPEELHWLDRPPKSSYAQALALLQQLGAIKRNHEAWVITAHGTAMSQLPCHPRLAHMVLKGADWGQADLACCLAALLSGKDIYTGQSPSADIDLRLQWLTDLNSLGSKSSSSNTSRSYSSKPPPSLRGSIEMVKQQRRQFQQMLRQYQGTVDVPVSLEPTEWVGVLLLQAYPDRGATKRQSQSVEYRLANGRAAEITAGDTLQSSSWLAVAQLGSVSGRSKERIWLAAALNPARFDDLLAPLVQIKRQVEWRQSENRFIANEQRCLGQLVLSEKPLTQISHEEKLPVLLDLVRRKGLGLLSFSDTVNTWRYRVQTMHDLCSQEADNPWPDLSDQALLNTLDIWLGPYLQSVEHLNHFKQLDVLSILQGLLPWPLPKQLDELLPQVLQVPSGSKIRVDYAEQPPVLAARLQEMLGCSDTPTLVNGRLAVKMHLLSPARRPLAVTSDLASFWRNAYPEVRKEMKGRYPKHFWPESPMDAEAIRGVRPK